VTPPTGVELTPLQALACAFRILAAEGFSENMAGHITSVAGPEGDMWVNPWGLWWDEVSTSDLCRVDADGRVLEGRWDVTPAIHIHTELHRRRRDARVVVHNHPYHATVLAALGVIPEILHQTSCVLDGEMVFVDEYTGEIDAPDLGEELAERIGAATVAVLANHGVIVTGPTVEQATYKAAVFDRQCRLTYDVMCGSGRLGTHRTIPEGIRASMKQALDERAAAIYWNGWVRRLLRSEPEVLR
jgi:ribulose-5-phosphate 4-epimerase/fuculose-1-phosphate aldolase